MTFRIEHRIGVAAPAPHMWALISDLDRWGEWNPVYPIAKGRIAIGAPIEFRLELPGRKPMTYTGKVGDWVPGEQLIWTARFAGGLVRTTRYIEIEALTETGCILSNGELYEGVAADWMPGKLRNAVRQGFQTMNERAKDTAEAGYARDPDVVAASPEAATA